MKILQIFILLLIITLAGCMDERHELQITGVVDYVADKSSCKLVKDVYKPYGKLDLAQYLVHYSNFNYDYILKLYVNNNQLIEIGNKDEEIKLKKSVTITSATVTLKAGTIVKRVIVDQEDFVLGSTIAVYKLSIKDALRPLLIDMMEKVEDYENLYEYLQLLDEDENLTGLLDENKLLRNQYELLPEGRLIAQKLWELFQSRNRKDPGHYMTVEVILDGKRADGSLLQSNKFTFKIEVESEKLFYLYFGDQPVPDKAVCHSTCFDTYQDFPITCKKNQ